MNEMDFEKQIITEQLEQCTDLELLYLISALLNNSDHNKKEAC